MGLKSKDECPYRKRGRHTETLRGEHRVMMEAGVGVEWCGVEAGVGLASTSPKTARISGNREKQGQRDGTDSPSDGTNLPAP